MLQIITDLIQKKEKKIAKTKETSSEKEETAATKKEKKQQTTIAETESIPITHLQKLASGVSPRPKSGDIVEGPVIAVKKSAVYIDLPPYGTGIIFGREFINARDIIKKVSVGDRIAAKVVMGENEDGYTELSLKEARQAILWNDAEVLVKNKTVL